MLFSQLRKIALTAAGALTCILSPSFHPQLVLSSSIRSRYSTSKQRQVLAQAATKGVQKESSSARHNDQGEDDEEEFRDVYDVMQVQINMKCF